MTISVAYEHADIAAPETGALRTILNARRSWRAAETGTRAACGPHGHFFFGLGNPAYNLAMVIHL